MLQPAYAILLTRYSKNPGLLRLIAYIVETPERRCMIIGILQWCVCLKRIHWLSVFIFITYVKVAPPS